MAEFLRMSVGEQVAAHLRRDLEAGGRRGIMPGVLKLEKELGVNRKTVEEALRQLEAEGFLAAQGAGRRRKIVRGKKPVRKLTVGILLYEPADRGLDYIIGLRHELEQAGHATVTATRTITEVGMDVNRLCLVIGETEADAWLAFAAPVGLLNWFLEEGIPVFALFGRRRELRIAGAGPDKVLVYAEIVRKLAGLGHRRIVLLTRPDRRLPQPGAPERAFLNELSAQGLSVGSYNLPDWEENTAGLHARLDALFLMTPPTALILDQAPFFFAALQFLSRRGLMVPEDVSLVCTDGSPDFEWLRPPVSHIRWDSRPLVRRVLKWASNISRGKEDLRQIEVPAEFDSGGTIGPVKR
jgi:hypothetical protein